MRPSLASIQRLSNWSEDCAGRPLITLRSASASLLVCGQHPLLRDVEQQARGDAHRQHRQRDAVDADAARLHGRDLVAARQDAERHQHGRPAPRPGHREGDLEEVERVVVHDHAARHVVLLDVVDQVHEVGQQEDRGERHQHERARCRSRRARCSGRAATGKRRRRRGIRSTTTGRGATSRGRAAARAAAPGRRGGCGQKRR